MITVGAAPRGCVRNSERGRKNRRLCTVGGADLSLVFVLVFRILLIPGER